MKVSQEQLTDVGQMGGAASQTEPQKHLVLVFGSRELVEEPDLLPRLRECYPGACFAGCTTAGEINASGVRDDTLVLTSLEFEDTTVRTCSVAVESMRGSEDVGLRIAEELRGDDLQYVLVLSDGTAVNGSLLVEGLREGFGEGVPFSGGLAGDGARFEKTLVLHTGGVDSQHVVGVGFYGGALRVARGSFGGWVPFGPYRTVSRSEDNIVYELDGQPALEVYCAYLGEDAANLPASGLLFPLAIEPELGTLGLIRTLLAVDREKGSLVFAGNVPEGVKVQLMHADYDQLVDGAGHAAEMSVAELGGPPDFALLISCVGRKLMMGNSVDFEVQAVAERMGSGVPCAGFYSYGEIGPFEGTGRCELHNQTMTVTALAE